MTGSSILSRSNDPVLAGETTIGEAARRHAVSTESINRWRNRFVDAGKTAMEDGMPGKAGSRGSLVERVLRRRGLFLPRGFRADRKSWAALRRKVFHGLPILRNGVWQADFSEFETPSGGIWRICAVIDYATKYCLAATITPTAAASTLWLA